MRNPFRVAAGWFADAAYKLARVTRTNKNWQPRTGDSEHEIKSAWDLLLARTRDLARNTPTGKRIADLLADMIVGSGIETYATPFSSDILNRVDSPGLFNDRLLRDLEYCLESDDFFNRWKQFADADGEGGWSDLERLACYELVNSGNAILLECALPVDDDREIPLCYQVIERDQLDSTKDRPRGPATTKILNGIEYDSRNRKIAYHIFGAHPDAHYDGNRAMVSTRVPARRVIHVFLRFRPTQRTGTPWTTEAGQAIRDGDWYLSSELTSAAIQSVVTFIHKMAHPRGAADLAGDRDDTDDNGNPTLKLGHGVVFECSTDDEFEMAESKRPNRDASPFLQEIRTEQSMGAGISPVRLTRDYRTHSYTSARAAHLDDDAHIKPLQQWLAAQLSIPVRRRVNAMAAGMGLFGTVTPQEFQANRQRLQQFDALGPGREQLNPDAETDAARGKLEAGLSTLKIENGRRQQHWIRILIQMAIEKGVVELLGLRLDYSKGQGGQPGENAADKKADESESEETEAVADGEEN